MSARHIFIFCIYRARRPDAFARSDVETWKIEHCSWVGYLFSRRRQKNFMTPDAKILSALRAHPAGVSGAQMAEQLDISRTAIWARIEELRQVGYDIEASPHFGYKLVSSPDALHA